VERLSQLVESPWPFLGAPAEMVAHRMNVINLAANIDTRIQKMYEVRMEGGRQYTTVQGRDRAVHGGTGTTYSGVVGNEVLQAGPQCDGLCPHPVPSNPTSPTPAWPFVHVCPALSCLQVIECDIAPQVASRGVGIAPYKGRHSQGSGGEAAADIYRQAAAGDAGPSTSSLPSSGGCMSALCGALGQEPGRQERQAGCAVLLSAVCGPHASRACILSCQLVL
jgi:hypothetical protein